MSRYRRYRVAGGTYFFTVVTFERRPILASTTARTCLRNAFRVVRAKWPFAIDAIVLLPDHLHTIWSLPRGDSRYSLRWQKVKEHFTRAYSKVAEAAEDRGASRERAQERAIWQRRFWEHTCRDEADVKRYADYLHWNPVKHGLAARARDYPWSSFHRFVALGEYEPDWGSVDPCPNWNQPE